MLFMAHDPTNYVAGGARLRATLASPRARRGGVAGLLVCVGLMWASCSSAFALAQRGHVFSFAVGAKGSEEGEFSDPVGVAVNDGTGEVYVSDRKNRRVEMFKPTRDGEGMLTGEEFAGQAEVGRPGPIAVDNSRVLADPSTGDVYVVEGHKAIYKLSAEGAVLGEITRFEEGGIKHKFEPIDGLAVNAGGELLVYQEDGAVDVFDDAASNQHVSHLLTAVGKGEPGFALDSEGNLYAGVENAANLPVIAKLDGSTGLVLAPELLSEDTTAVAVNPLDTPENLVDEQNDVYLASQRQAQGAAASEITQLDPAGALIQHLPAPNLEEVSGVAVDAQTGAVFVTDAATNKLDVFTLEPGAQPSVTIAANAIPPSPPDTSDTRLTAQVNPTGAPTSYQFEYGTTACTSPGSCSTTTAASAGEGFGDQEETLDLTDLPPAEYHYRITARSPLGTTTSPEGTFTILDQITGLPDNRAWEMISPSEPHSAHIEGMAREGGWILAAEDGDAFTYLVTGVLSEEEQANRSPEMQQVIATRGSSGWTSRDIATPTAKEQGANVGQGPEYQFFSSDLSLGLVDPYEEEARSSPALAPAAEQATVYLRANPPIEPGATERSSYEEATANASFLAPGYVPLVSELNVMQGTAFGGTVEFQGATADLGHVILRSGVALTGPGSAPGLYEWSVGGGLKYISSYEGSPSPEAELGHDGLLVANAISEDGTRVIWSAPVTNPHLYMTDTATGATIRLDEAQGVAEPTSGGAFFQSASPDGSRVLFTSTEALTKDSTANANERDEDLYECEIKEAAAQLSCKLSDLTEGVAVAGEHAAVEGLSGSSEDAGEVYLVAAGVLTSQANERGEEPQPGGDNLYELRREGSGDAWATSFIATLSSEDNPDWAGSSNAANTAFLTTRVSPNGRYLAFMSQRSLTGYDNEDVSSLVEGERRDEEVYVFDASTRSIRCVSCNPTGARPRGVLDKGESGEGFGLLVDGRGAWTGHWLAGSVPGWTAQSLSRALVQPRYLSNEGRLFFDSADPLVPGIDTPTREENVDGHAQTVGVENVYEYEPAGVGCEATSACLALLSGGTSQHESAFLEATPSGDDAFFLSSAPLTPQDLEGAPTVYDARVCTAVSPCLAAPPGSSAPCDSLDACHPESRTQGATLSPPASATFSGPGNMVPTPIAQQEVEPSKTVVKPVTRAQKLAKALETCKRQHRDSAKRRRSCEARARTLYGPKRKRGKK
jgi:DNA-binding beta-propeller fold protein YncE